MSACEGCSDPYCGDCAAREYLAIEHKALMEKRASTTRARDRLWIAWQPSKKLFLKHPRGEWTKNIDEAYGWHYKKAAQMDCDFPVKRRETLKKELNIK